MKALVAAFPTMLAVLILIVFPCGNATAATIWVDSMTDDGLGGCTLREAIQAANTNTAVGGCEAGAAGYDSIYFNHGGTIVLTGAIAVTESLNICGPNAVPDGVERSNPVVIKAAAGQRHFVFDSGGHAAQYNLGALTLMGPTSGAGGGVVLGTGDDMNISSCIFKGCRATTGGAIFNSNGDFLQVESCLLVGNSAFGKNGGAIYSNGSGALYVRTSIVSGNSAAGDGGGLYAIGQVTILDSTFAGNRAAFNAGGVALNSTSSKTVTNSIFWGNAAPDSPQIGFSGTSVIVTYSDVDGGNIGSPDPTDPWPGAGNIFANPLFIAARPASEAPTAAGNYHLKAISPCVNHGTETSQTFDLDGDLLGQDGHFDIGADEAGPPFNDSFEYGTAVPAPWQGTNLGPDDRRVSTTHHLGASSFRITGSAANKSLRQSLPLGGGTSYDVTLSGWSKASGTALGGGPYRIEAKIFYDDDSTGLVTLSFPKKTHPWTSRSKTLKVPKNVTKIVVYLRYAGQTGTAWFDDIKVSVRK